MTNAYQTAYDQSINAPNEFWGKQPKRSHGSNDGTRFWMTATLPFTGGLQAGNSIPATMPWMSTWKTAVVTRRR
jgi:hypothetical protein